MNDTCGIDQRGLRPRWGCRMRLSTCHRALHDAFDRRSFGADFCKTKKITTIPWINFIKKKLDIQFIKKVRIWMVPHKTTLNHL